MGVEVARTPETAGTLPMKRISPEKLGKFYEHYAEVFLGKLEDAFGNKLFAGGIDGLTLENARKIAPLKAQARSVLQKVIEERLYDSGVNLMKEGRYWQLLRETYEAMAEDIAKREGRTVSSLMRRQVMEQGLSQLVIRSERARIQAMLGSMGQEAAWKRFVGIIRKVASAYDRPMGDAALGSALRKAALSTRDHREFFLEVFGVKGNPEMGKKLLTDLDLSDIHYNPKGEGNKLLPPRDRALINMSLDAKLVPLDMGLLEDPMYRKATFTSFRGTLRAASLDAVGGMIIINEDVARAMGEVFALSEHGAAKVSEAKESAKKGRGAPKRAARRRPRIGGFGKMAALEAALGALAFYLISNPEKVTSLLGKKKAAEMADLENASLLLGKKPPVLESTPKKKKEKIEDVLDKVAPAPGAKESVMRMLNSLKVNGKSLTQAQKLRALKIASSRMGFYEGEEMERFVKIAAIMQFVPRQSDKAVALRSEEILELEPAHRQERTARSVAEKKAGKEEPAQKKGEAQEGAGENAPGKTIFEEAGEWFGSALKKVKDALGMGKP